MWLVFSFSLIHNMADVQNNTYSLNKSFLTFPINFYLFSTFSTLSYKFSIPITLHEKNINLCRGLMGSFVNNFHI